MRARDVMTFPLVSVSPDTSVDEIARVLLGRGISAVPVLDAHDRLVGIVSEGDLVRRAEAGTERRRPWWLAMLAGEQQARDYVKAHGRRAADVMTRDVISVGERATLAEIATLLEKHRIKRVPVLREGRVVGIASRANLLHGLAVQTAPVEFAREHRQAEADRDVALRGRVLEELKSAGVDASFINIVVYGGVAHLWGMARSTEQHQAARIAAESAGAAYVEDHLGILPAAVPLAE